MLTSRFKTLPEAYYDFVYTIDEMSGEGIANAIKRAFADDAETRLRKSTAGLEYIKNHQTYDRIAENLINFMENVNLAD